MIYTKLLVAAEKYSVRQLYMHVIRTYYYYSLRFIIRSRFGQSLSIENINHE
jgi:hypothetical protein